MNELIDEFLNKYDNYDIRKTNNARWIDQKCAADVVNLIADCVINFVTEKGDKSICFTAKDIWDFSYSADVIKFILTKYMF